MFLSLGSSSEEFVMEVITNRGRWMCCVLDFDAFYSSPGGPLATALDRVTSCVGPLPIRPSLPWRAKSLHCTLCCVPSLVVEGTVEHVRPP